MWFVKKAVKPGEEVQPEEKFKVDELERIELQLKYIRSAYLKVCDVVRNNPTEGFFVMQEDLVENFHEFKMKLLEKTFRFGENLRNLRERAKLTQVELADLIGVAPEMISRFENEKRFPTFRHLFSIAVFFNVSIDELLFSETEVKE